MSLPGLAGCVALTLLGAGFAVSPAVWADDASVALVLAGHLDDRCAILTAEQRQRLDDYRRVLERAAVPQSTAGAGIPVETDVAGTVAAMDCPRARFWVRDAYEDAVAALAAAKVAPLTAALNVGTRCAVLSDADKQRLMVAWRRERDEIARRFNARVRMKYVMHEHAHDIEAERIVCTRAGIVVQSALQGLPGGD